MHIKHAIKTIAMVLAFGSFAFSAAAQWQWIDKDGRKVYSDRSPPSDINEKNIVKRPGGAAVAALSPATAAIVAPSAKDGAPALTGKDPQLEAKKKQAENEEAARKKVDDEKVAKAKTDNCDLAKRSLSSIDSGMRIATTNSKGEREIMDDARRNEERKRVQGIADSSCK
jgi:Domain of unknown function (DUF4124)